MALDNKNVKIKIANNINFRNIETLIAEMTLKEDNEGNKEVYKNNKDKVSLEEDFI